MKITIEIPSYSRENGLRLIWAPNYKIECRETFGTIHIMANADGLVSLANHCLTLAQNSVPSHAHIHYDEYGGLEEGSLEFILEKI